MSFLPPSIPRLFFNPFLPQDIPADILAVQHVDNYLVHQRYYPASGAFMFPVIVCRCLDTKLLFRLQPVVHYAKYG